MKKIIFTVSVVVLFCNSVFAQDNISNKFYFRYALSNPTKNNFEYNSWSDNLTTKKGGAIEFGSIVYFKFIKLGSKSKLGMDITYLSASKHKMGFDPDKNIDINLDVNLGGDGINIDENITASIFYPQISFYNIGSKLGPIYTYNIWNKLNVDVFAKVNPIWINAAIYDYQNEEPLKYFKGFMGLKYSFGMNVRYDFIMLGAELNLGKLKYQSVDDNDIYVFNNLLIPQSKETNSACFNLSLGFCF
jgi:hypothetical protein